MTTTIRSALAAVLLAACHPNAAAPVAPATGGNNTEPARMAKKVSLSWGITQGADSSDVFLAVADETGAQVSHPVGTYAGTCKVIVPTVEMHAVIAVACTYGGTGWQLRAVVRGEEVIVMKLRSDQGVAPDPMSGQEVTRVTAPPGAAIEATPAP